MKRTAPSLALVLPLVLAACAKNEPPQTKPGAAAGSAIPGDELLKVGDTAPEVPFVLQNGQTVKLSSLRGKAVAVYFYPKDQTPGCTIEAQGIRDNYADLQKEGVTVIGVSKQDAESHKAFIDKEKLPYDLAIDADGKIAQAFGVPLTLGYHARQTFLVGKDGKIKKVWRKVAPDGHAAEILAAAKS